MQWIANLFGRPTKEETPVKTFRRNGLRAHVFAKDRSCGHVGHLVEFQRYLDDEDFEGERAWFPVALIFDEELRDAIILLQESQEFISKERGVKALPTVQIGGRSYFLDARLGEFRNVDDPFDVILTERIG